MFARRDGFVNADVIVGKAHVNGKLQKFLHFRDGNQGVALGPVEQDSDAVSQVQAAQET